MGQLINSRNQTVQSVKNGIISELNLQVENLDNFANIAKSELSEVLGDAMVQSVNAFFVTADTCQSYPICNDGTPIGLDSAEKCATRRELVLENLFTLDGARPFDLIAFGLPPGFGN